MKLECYKLHNSAPKLVPGRAHRAWMDEFPERFAYRCLPLTMANTTGWELLCPMDFTVDWNGGPDRNDIRITTEHGDPRAIPSYIDSHFSRGVVTFHTSHLFRSPPGWAIWAGGAPNWPKDGIAPLSGLIETDWLPFPFTMNWKMTRPGKVTFEKGEPFCFITLVEHKKVEEFEPERMLITTNPELMKEYKAWSVSRADFNSRLEAQDPDAVKESWQRHYMKGETVTGDKVDDHQSRRRLKVPKEL